MESSDEGIFMSFYINSRVYIMFNKGIKSMIEPIKVSVNDIQTKVTPHENEDSDLISHNDRSEIIIQNYKSL